MVIQIHRLNASISLFLALCLNAILILLVVKRSPKEMKVYKRILLQTAIVDIALSVLSFLSQDEIVFLRCRKAPQCEILCNYEDWPTFAALKTCGADICGADICGAHSKRHLRRRHLRRDI
ncbi:hypothetical protein niasHS_008357 [Heterodera schachtii]|uniref:Uncharacterized protein n=1 Tax=Heterodera schachtii TaxID=97005 RepID=A0ABD2JD15_HETSC